MSTVQDLPPKFVPPKPLPHHNGMAMATDTTSGHSPTALHHRVIEDTAATPPTYKYEKAKEISLEESLTLQKSQKMKQDVSYKFAATQENQYCGFQIGLTQTELYKGRRWHCDRRWLEAGNFGFRKQRNYSVQVVKTKALISFAVTAKLICVFVFTNAECWFSHAAALI